MKKIKLEEISDFPPTLDAIYREMEDHLDRRAYNGKSGKLAFIRLDKDEARSLSKEVATIYHEYSEEEVFSMLRKGFHIMLHGTYLSTRG